MKKFRRGQGAPVFAEGVGAPVPRHNGTMASPSLHEAGRSNTPIIRLVIPASLS